MRRGSFVLTAAVVCLLFASVPAHAQFDTKAIDEVIKDVEAGRAISDLEYQAAQALSFLRMALRRIPTSTISLRWRTAGAIN